MPEDEPAPATHPLQWRLDAWDRPDLMYANNHASTRYQGWDRYVPYLELVQCGETVKPALFFKIGFADFADWAEAVEPREIVWNWYRTKGEVPYVVIDLYVLFVNGNGTTIGTGGTGQGTVTTADAHRYSHQLRSRTLLDPADPAHREAIETWAATPDPTMLFFIEENFRATAHVWVRTDSAAKQVAVEKLAEATEELGAEGVVPGGFRDACASSKDTLPPVSWWY